MSIPGSDVVVAIDPTQSLIPSASSITTTSGTATTSSGSTIALAANSVTKFLTIQNTSSSGILYIGVGAAATTSMLSLAAGVGYEFPVVPSQAIYLLGSASVSYVILSA